MSFAANSLVRFTCYPLILSLLIIVGSSFYHNGPTISTFLHTAHHQPQHRTIKPSTALCSNKKDSSLSFIFDNAKDESVKSQLLILQDRLSFNENEWKEVIQKLPSILNVDYDIKSKFIFLRDQFDYDEKEIRKFILLFPRVFSIQDIPVKTQYLQKALKLTNKQLGKMAMVFPSLLGLSVSGCFQPKLIFLQKRLNIKSFAKLKRMIQKFPSVFGLSIEENMIPKLDYLQKRLELNEKDLSKIICTAPQIIGCSIDENLEPKLKYLEKRLNLDLETLNKVIRRQPELFNLSIEDTLEPKMQYLQTRLNLEDEELSLLLCRLPNVLGCNIEDNVEPKIQYLQQRLKLNEEDLKRMIIRSPYLFSLDIESNIEPSLKFLKQRLSLQEEGLCNLIYKRPTLLNLTQKNIDDKMTFFEDLIGVTLARASIVRTPNPLTASLQYRLKPRWKDVREVGITKIDYGLVQQMANYSNVTWAEKIANTRANNKKTQLDW